MQMLGEGQTPEKACYKLLDVDPPMSLYRDAGQGPAIHFITILDCLRGLKKGLDCGLISFDNFDVQE